MISPHPQSLCSIMELGLSINNRYSPKFLPWDTKVLLQERIQSCQQCQQIIQCNRLIFTSNWSFRSTCVTLQLTLNYDKSTFSCLPSQYSHRRLCGRRGDSGDRICASCSKESVPKTQLRRHLNWSEKQDKRFAHFCKKNVTSTIFSGLGILLSSVLLVRRTKPS